MRGTHLWMALTGLVATASAAALPAPQPKRYEWLSGNYLGESEVG